MKCKICVLGLIVLGICCGWLTTKVYRQNKVVETKKEVVKKEVVKKACETSYPENIYDYLFSYSESEGFCDNRIDDYTRWTRSKTPTGELGLKWDSDGVLLLALVFDNKTKIIHRVLSPDYLVKQNLNFSKTVLSNRFFLISDESMVSPDGSYLVFSVNQCAGCGDGVFKDEKYLYNTINDKVRSLGTFNSDQSEIKWLGNQVLKIGEKTITLTKTP